MSALARYFLHEGVRVAGYDRTPSRLTAELEAEGAAIHYDDDVRPIPGGVSRPGADTMVVYTPAVPQDHGEYRYFCENGVHGREALADAGSSGRGQIRDGGGGHARQDDDVDARGVAQPGADGRRFGFLGRHIEELRRQPRAGRRGPAGGRGR